MATLDSLAASAGLGPLGSLGPLLVGVVLLLLIVKLLSMPFKLVWNGICGAIVLWLVNVFGALVGFGMKITVIKALIAGFFGIPGAVAVILFEIFAKH
ncbi:pro-sigmaK processing inhibitor BofA family protein [uncultured Phascolarctobacterium sp.]|uniref:pro-sigmaK processing inhibitor BofA family protein n=1 Tax=uncultured Phascolarctobacterium sp. TaxID=512296 RepID=UPI00261E92AD|nr:pro-sigmaK processing inhibitor BofA family protein [uncultured Phascolarctobacterium sp.]